MNTFSDGGPIRLPTPTRGGHHPLRELFTSRVIEFCREPEALFWVYGFPILMVLSLGIAFRDGEVGDVRIAVVGREDGGAEAASPASVLAAAKGIRAEIRDRTAALDRLRTGRIDLVVEPTGDRMVTYHLDASRPESVLARDRAAESLERAAGRQDLYVSREERLTAPGGRYIDFLVPGLMGLSLMGGGLWGVGFVTVEMRLRKLLKRFLATPMRRSDFLLSIMLSRMLFMIPEMVIILVFSRVFFGVRIFGSPWAVAFLLVLGATCFSGLGLLLASRAKTLETVSGLLNLVMLPMWLASGVFFSRERYPEWLQPVLAAMPLSPLVDALRGVMLEGLSLADVWLPVAMLAAWGLVSFAVALRVFRWM